VAEPYSRMTDILFGMDLDLHFENGDLMTCTGIDYIKREIFKVLLTDPGDWKLHQNIGGSPHAFIGEPNSREVGESIRSHIYNNLYGVVYPAGLEVRVVPVATTKLMVFIDIFVMGLETTTIPFEFDYAGGLRYIQAFDSRITTPVSSTDYKINEIGNTQRPNKYWERLREGN
jgi:hypothetical protein